MVRHGSPPYLECSTKGDIRFSALRARPDSLEGKSIEEAYQAMKIFPDGSTNLSISLAKGRRAVNHEECAKAYEQWWREWVLERDLLPDLRAATGLSDMFGQPGSVCQATVLWKIRNGRTVIICGSRPPEHIRKDTDKLAEWYIDNYGHIQIGVDEFEEKFQVNIDTVISGTAEGFDTLAEVWSESKLGRYALCFPADWKKNGKAAGMIRNGEMLKWADGVLAFWDGKSRGTADMIRRAEQAGLLVHVCRV